ncbi:MULTISPECIES: hypothetical protein [Caldimonas]|uniref:hypothetical protein n=1 Tax=Caldimonas TaxID=196013 RepID=UPI0007804523|nr:hypothetical protein [Caldimonas taiwanensis]GIX25890.1 MAG: hypothetical protein KatS3mg122_3121 [Caldimonas sp.]
MNDTTIQVPARLLGLVMMARLLQRLDTSREPVDARQYHDVVRRLQDLLRTTPVDDALKAVLNAYPAAGEVYENLRYEHAGLCLQPLERSMGTELQAREVLRRVARMR